MRRRQKDLLARIDELERTVADLRTGDPIPAASMTAPPTAPPSDRRGFLRAAGVGAVGVVGGLVAGASPASAHDADDVQKSVDNQGVSATTGLTGTLTSTILDIDNDGTGGGIRGVTGGTTNAAITAVSPSGGISIATQGGSRVRLGDGGSGAGVAHQAGDLWRNGNELLYAVEVGTPGQSRVLGSLSTAGALHPLAAPIRCYDSRPGQIPTTGGGTKGVFANGDKRAIDPRNTTPVPAGVIGVLVNLTAVPHGTLGYLKAWANDEAEPTVSMVNYGGSTPVANMIYVACASDARIVVKCTGGSSDVIVDVIAYYR